ncbi:unnamed protein product [Litomosoides sigmodontis]|uniref:Uncharacterized protein n=1 Tax=Litomosoides sigmodontis TaxID=42156 RepID=A0A3P6SZK0_LITSI|nr:unnamed protein product [Litomosoides sigmodontis]
MGKEGPVEARSIFERGIRKTGCWTEHLACAECINYTKDWRECKEELEKFRNCVQNYMKDKTKPSEQAVKRFIIWLVRSIPLKEPMLSELFAELTIDSNNCDINSCSHENYIDPRLYVPLDRSPRWFLHDNLNNGDNTDEIARNRAAFAYLQGDYITAMDIYFSLLKNDAKSSSNKSNFALVDSIIRCSLKISPMNGPQMLFWLQKLHSLVSTYDEQLQYWIESLEVYSATGINTSNYLRNAILLCANVDLPEFWISISKNAPESCTNLRIGSLCRAICILENLVPSKARCFDCHKLKLMKAELRDLCNEEKQVEVKAAICGDLMRGNAKTVEINHHSFCKGVLKDKKAEDVMILEFTQRFYWLFTDANKQVINVILKGS